MTKTFIVDSRKYTVDTCTAIALNSDYFERQDALLVTVIHLNEEGNEEGERYEAVVFGMPGMPVDVDDLLCMIDEPYAWDSDCETLETVILK